MDNSSPVESPRDCLGCRVTGTLTGVGVGLYGLHERSKIPSNSSKPSVIRHRHLLLGLSLGTLTIFLIDSCNLRTKKKQFTDRWNSLFWAWTGSGSHGLTLDMDFIGHCIWEDICHLSILDE